MHTDPTYLSLIAALLGGVVGSAASLLAFLYARYCQDRLHRIACEVAKRETVYAEFVTSASTLLCRADAIETAASGRGKQDLIALINRMRLFAPPNVVRGAESVLRATVEISLPPSLERRRFAKQAFAERLDPDPLLAFSSICRADLDQVRRTAA